MDFASIARSLGAKDQPLFAQGVIVALLLIALAKWGHELWAASCPKGAAVTQKAANGVNAKDGATTPRCPDSRLDLKPPADSADNQPGARRIHSHASGFLPTEEDEDKRGATTCGPAPMWNSKAVTVKKFGE